MAVQKNYAYQAYIDDNGVTWNVRGEVGGPFAAVDGSAAFSAGAPVWGRQSKRRHVRWVEATDPTTFRKSRHVIYTPGAFAAITGGQAVNVSIPGNAAAVAYNVTAKIPERQPVAGSSRQLADHA